MCIRYDLLQRVFSFTRDAGFQEEKYESLYLKLNWTKSHLEFLLDRRINYLIKQRYTTGAVTHQDILSRSIQKQDPLDYILERTFMRPRDLISFFNQCIQNSVDSPLISPKTIQLAEHEYSRSRFRSLGDEWFADYPNLLDFALLLKSQPARFTIADLSNEHCADFCLTHSTNEIERKDILSTHAYQVATGVCPVQEFKKVLFQILYRVGLVGLKLEPFEEYTWSHNLARSIPSPDLSEETKVAIHPMFH